MNNTTVTLRACSWNGQDYKRWEMIKKGSPSTSLDNLCHDGSLDLQSADGSCCNGGDKSA